MQSVFPPDDSYTYVIQSHTPEGTKCFDGAPSFSFNTTVRININEPEEVNSWLKKLMEASHCTYRVFKGRHKPLGKRLLCKHEMHCQHFRKSLTSMQLQRSAATKAKTKEKPMCLRVRENKTQCSSNLTISLQLPTKKQSLAAEKQPFLLSHRAVLRLNLTHNHPINAAHTVSFRPISEITKQQIFDRFDKGHSSSSARHTHEQMLILNA